MGIALELITGLATAPGAGVNMTALTGNSFTLRDTQKPIWLGPVSLSKQLTGGLRITSPLLHDSTVGINLNAGPGQGVVLWPQPIQRLHAQDSLTLRISGSAVAGDIEHASFLAFYEDLPGVAARLIDKAELNRRGEAIYAFTNALTLDATGQYSGSELINAEEDQLKANRDYAIMGYTMRANACAAIRWLSSDWGNLGVGGPGVSVSASGPNITADWFVRVSDLMRMPAIPVFNAANKALTFISGVQDENALSVTVSTICCLLSPKR